MSAQSDSEACNAILLTSATQRQQQQHMPSLGRTEWAAIIISTDRGDTLAIPEAQLHLGLLAVTIGKRVSTS